MSMINKNLVAAILVSIGIFVTWAWTLPSYQAAGLLNDIAEEKELELVSKEETLSKIESFYQEYRTKEDSIKRLAQIIPVTKSLPELVTMVETTSTNNGIQIVSFVTNDQLGPSGAQYDILNLELDLLASYPSLVVFLNAIEKNLRLFDADSINISVPTDTQSNLLTIEVNLKGYVLKEEVKQQQTGAGNSEE